MTKRGLTSTVGILAGLLLAGGAAVANEPAHEKGSQSGHHFFKEAAQGGMAEVALGQMAAEKGQNEAVKSFGQRMVKDHGKANDELKTLAKKEGVTLPTEMNAKDKALQQQLEKLSGAEFDREYMKEMVKDHKKDIKAFEKQANQGKDPQVKAWASQTLPTLREHLELANAAAGKVGVKTDAMESSSDKSTEKTSSSSEARQKTSATKQSGPMGTTEHTNK